MYSIFADGLKIFDDQVVVDELVVINPKLTLADNSAGSLEMTLPVGNVGYSTIKRLTSEIVVKKYDKEIWSGRVLTEDNDWLNRRKLYCEGELAYLNDSVQPPGEFHNFTIADFLNQLIDVHNQQVEKWKQFKLGTVQVSDDINDNLYRYTNFESTMECINDKLLDRLGGHLRIRKAGGTRMLDYLSDYPRTSNQVINFGENLLDYSKSFDMSELCTIIIPRGAMLDESPIEALQAYLTVESVNDGSIFVVNEDLVSRYGQIVKIVDWEDVTEPSNLLRKAKEFLSDTQYEKMVLEISAADLSYLRGQEYEIRLLDEIKCISSPHGLNKYFPVTKLTINLDNPVDTLLTLGDEFANSYTSATGAKIDHAVSQITQVTKVSEKEISDMGTYKQDKLEEGAGIIIDSNNVIKVDPEYVGSKVSVTPLLNTGTPIANLSIDGVVSTLFAPTGGGGGDAKVYYGTTAYWNSQPTLQTEQGALYIYSDYKQNPDQEDIPGLKVGDGNAYLIDAPFVDDIYARHILDMSMHVTAQEKTFWNNKVRAYVDPNDPTNLILTKN